MIGGLNDALFFAKGYGGPAALLASIVFILFVLPAAILAIWGRLLPVAAVLAGGAAMLYAFDPVLRLMSPDHGLTGREPAASRFHAAARRG